jgi:hypothetical protein
MPLRRRECEVCTNTFQPPHRAAMEAPRRCKQCRDLSDSHESSGYERASAMLPDLPKAPVHTLGPPLKQGVFDLETFALDRGWGVLLVGSILVHGEGEPIMHTFDLRQSSKWPAVRSDDSELAARILEVLGRLDLGYAHNGLNFDFPWLNSIALKYGMPPLRMKLIDPVQVARRKYRIGSNSLGNIADFLNAPEKKMPLSADVWRKAIFDADDAAWALLRDRCESDVRVLNFIAGRITRDVGMIDYTGSAWR